METIGLTPSHEYLRNAAQACFAKRYGDPVMHIDVPLSQNLQWVPALRFTISKYINVFVEPAEDGPYPRLFGMKYLEVINFPQPIAIYSVCPASVIGTPKGQKDVKFLKTHGFGLITVDESGNGTHLFSAVPLIQWISDTEFNKLVSSLPKSIRRQASEAFVDYCNNPVNGVKTLSELVEGMVKKAAVDATKLKILGTPINTRHISQAKLLSELHDKLPNAQPAIGAARAFTNYYRNLSHHWPQGKKAAYEKFTECRHHFLEGLHTIRVFREAMRNNGLTGNVETN